jgi:hypothetical protein
MNSNRIIILSLSFPLLLFSFCNIYVFGAHYTRLPFPIVAGERPSEFGVALGSGTRFLDPRTRREVAGLDLALERVWRREGASYREGAWLVTFGVTIKP